MGARGCNGGAVEIKVAIDLGPSRKPGVDAGAPEQVEGEEALWEEPVPEMEWESGGKAAKSGNEVVLECPDGSFCSILAVDAGWDQLVVNSNVGHVAFEDGRAFIV
jgi:hypothetical protein